VFDAFYTTKTGGTGLGLAIVHRIASEHGGELGVVSRSGCTRFTLHLPGHPEAPGQHEKILRESARKRQI
jgi:signal transduction histidine kinase